MKLCFGLAHFPCLCCEFLAPNLIKNFICNAGNLKVIILFSLAAMPGFTELTLSYSDHPSSLLKSLNLFRQHNHLLCDCALLIEEHRFPIHKAVLAASSEYFRALFTSDLKENGRSEITLNGISAHTFQLVLDFIYTGVVKVDQANITDIYAAADMLGLGGLRDLCQDYLLNQLCSSNCIGIWRYANSFHDRRLEESAWRYLTTHFTEVMEGQEYQELDPTNTHLIISSELDTVRDARIAVSGRLCHDTQEGGEGMRRLLSHIRQSDFLPTERLHNSNSYQPLSHLRSLVTVGGYNNGLERTCEVYDAINHSWQLADWGLPSCCKHVHWVGVIGVRLYVIAGSGLTKINLIMSRLTNEAAEQLQTDALSTDWEEEAILPHDCSDMKFCVMHECIYGCGKITDTTYSVSRYNPGNGQWEFVADVVSDSKVFFQFFSHDNKLYLLGGLCTSSGIATCHFESYNPHTDSWEMLSEMAVARYNFGVGILEHCLYAVGGMGSDGVMLDSVERYCFETKMWSFISPLPSPRATMACGGWGGNLFSVGGETEGTSSVQTSDVLTFKPFTEEWITIASLSLPRIYPNIILL